MENLNKRSIIDMARGAIKERADYEMTRVRRERLLRQDGEVPHPGGDCS